MGAPWFGHPRSHGIRIDSSSRPIALVMGNNRGPRGEAAGLLLSPVRLVSDAEPADPGDGRSAWRSGRDDGPVPIPLHGAQQRLLDGRPSPRLRKLTDVPEGLLEELLYYGSSAVNVVDAVWVVIGSGPDDRPGRSTQFGVLRQDADRSPTFADCRRLSNVGLTSAFAETDLPTLSAGAHRFLLKGIRRLASVRLGEPTTEAVTAPQLDAMAPDAMLGLPHAA